MTSKWSPGQLYSTDSGHLYHAGRICIVMVGLPARGKTHRAEAISRYLRWLGVKSQAFHLSDVRRRISGRCQLPEDYYNPEVVDSELAELRDRIVEACFEEIWEFFRTGGQIAVYDAINGTAEIRRHIASRCQEHNVESLFVESLISDENLLARNIGDVNTTSPDYIGKDPHESVAHYLRKLELLITHYQPIAEPELPFIKVMNEGDKCIINHGQLGYLLNRVLLFLLNNRRRQGSVFLARAGTTGFDRESAVEDLDLSPEGRQYATSLANTLLGYITAKQLEWQHPHVDVAQMRRYADRNAGSIAPSAMPSAAPSAIPSTTTSRSASIAVSEAASRVPSPHDSPTGLEPQEPSLSEPPLVVWTSTRRKTMQTALPLQEVGCPVTNKSLLNLRNRGVAATIRESDLASWDADDYAAFMKDPYHHRHSRGESYQDVAIRLEPCLMETERVETNLLIIAHESILRVIYGYIMGSSVHVIPTLQFPANQIIELVNTGYSYNAVRIPIIGASLDGGVALPN